MKDFKKKTTFAKLFVLLLLCVGSVGVYLYLTYIDMIPKSYFLYLVLVVVIFLHLIHNTLDVIRNNKQTILRQNEENELSEAIEKNTTTFVKLYEEVMAEIEVRNKLSKYYRSKFYNIIPKTEEEMWKRHEAPNMIIVDKRRNIKCPPEIRDDLVDLQNNLRKILR